MSPLWRYKPQFSWSLSHLIVLRLKFYFLFVVFCCGFGHSCGSEGARRPEVLPVRCGKMRGKCLNCQHASRLDESAAKASLICELDLESCKVLFGLDGFKRPNLTFIWVRTFLCTLTVDLRGMVEEFTQHQFKIFALIQRYHCSYFCSQSLFWSFHLVGKKMRGVFFLNVSQPQWSWAELREAGNWTITHSHHPLLHPKKRCQEEKSATDRQEPVNKHSQRCVASRRPCCETHLSLCVCGTVCLEPQPNVQAARAQHVSH